VLVRAVWQQNTLLMASFLLVHGAFCRRWVWDATATALTASGHRVEALDLPSSGTDSTALSGLQDDVDTVRRALGASGTGAVLVGHSGGGLVLAELAGHAAVRHSVYVAALRAQSGQSGSDMLGGQISPWMTASPAEGVVRVSDNPDVVREALCADVEKGRFLRDIYPRYVLTSLKVLADPCSAPAASHETTYIICEKDQAVPVAAQQAMSATADNVESLPSSHSSLLSMPERLAQVLERAATNG
jgi:pimeloyl-ACP methyl ester carboxylesterase